MNPEQAYRAHTDWARAAHHTTNPHHDWFTARTRYHCRPLGTPTNSNEPGNLFRQYLTGDMSPHALRRLGPSVASNIVINYTPTTTRPSEPPLPGDVYGPEPNEPEPGSVEAQAVLIPENLYTDATLHMLATAPTYYVTDDMTTIVETAAAAFDDYDLMPRMPTETGFVVFAHPIPIPDHNGTQQVTALAWTSWGTMTTSLGIPGHVGDIWSFSTITPTPTTTGEDPVVTEARPHWPTVTAWRKAPTLLPGYADRYVTGEPVGPVEEDLALPQARSRVAALVQQTWAATREKQGEPVTPTPQEWDEHVTTVTACTDQEIARARAEHGGPKMVGRAQPYLAAFVLLLTQKITATSTQNPAPDAVRLARQVAERRPSTVTVVDVHHRHSNTPTEHDDHPTGSRRPLEHRHLVGAHWKWQPYGPDRSLRRRILVTGYVRGPENKPLKVSPRVTRLS